MLHDLGRFEHISHLPHDLADPFEIDPRVGVDERHDIGNVVFPASFAPKGFESHATRIGSRFANRACAPIAS